ncbi:MAG: DnaJ family domain-containing protein [Thermodesulfobacteriota bacterium]
MLEAFRIVAERKITEAMERGELVVEGWKNRPLVFEDDSHIPPELRMAFKILKNADCLPPEVELRRDIARLEELIATTEDEHTRLRQMKKLGLLTLKLNLARKRPVELEKQEHYYPKVVERLSVAVKTQSAAGGRKEVP